MSYIGVPPAQSFTALLKQDFTTSATTSYTLDHSVNNANDIALFINFVRQEPTAAYSASGTSLTLTSATSASDDMYCVFLGQALQTVNPPSGSVGTAQLADSAVSTAKIADDAVTKAKTSNLMYPAFEAFLSAAQDISDNTITKVQFNTEVFDTDNCYDNSTNYRFTPTVAGKYFVFAKIATDTIAGANLDQARIFIYKNGTSISIANLDARGNTLGNYYTCNDSIIVDMNGSSDYLEIFARIDDTSGDPDINGDSSERLTSFGAYRIGD